MWRGSESPVETFSDAEGGNEKGEWPVEIIGEEVDMSGVVRFEARWPTWKRADGSSVTWNNGYLTPTVLRSWKSRQKSKREEVLAESLDIDIWATLDIHNTETILRSQAYTEKLAERRKKPSDYLAQKMDKLMWEKLTPPHAKNTPSSTRAASALRASAVRQKTSTPRSTSVASVKSSASLSAGHTAAKTSHSTSQSTFSEGKSTRPLSSKAHSTITVKKPLTRRQLLQKTWSTIARAAGASRIFIVNDIDNEEIPVLADNFQYTELGYICDTGVQRIQEAGCFVTCDCDVCESPSTCNCQDPSELFDDLDRNDFAYTPDGLFAFNVPLGVEVIECNQYCRCDFSCRNRIAQRPRDVPIEVFKTAECGWGVRATVAVEKGKVLGVYTGLLIKRVTAEGFSDHEKAYCFDLDGRENQEEQPPENSYTVNSLNCGNWTRFINHSCDPNLRVYLVVYDTIPEMNQPYIAFVAVEDIPARTEFTFDYDPAATKAQVKGKGKGKAKVPAGAKPCMCGASVCRGWLRA